MRTFDELMAEAAATDLTGWGRRGAALERAGSTVAVLAALARLRRHYR
ncbi:hypothetical protein GGG17_01305 [Arsenicicoccus sp. MKL-02]|uniref:Uncharacterized protein n=1 Tax=Arsenicicoccus cauae TaxID=2663847 RepID=A0A6I3IDA8_9MICO|nr:hypothetical protein [Arsenicicoccus cauae]MTB70633.1 hypothetical protein [Arsenicicoccus cauae]